MFRLAPSLRLHQALICTLLLWGLIACDSGASKAGEAESSARDSVLTPSDSIQHLIQSLSEQIRMYPKNPALYIERSYLLYTSGDTPLAIEDIEKAMQLNPKDPEAYYLRGFYDLVSNKDTTAEAYLMKAVEFGSENPETYYSLGNLNTFRKKYSEALKWYKVAMEKDSLDPGYPYACGMVYYQQKNYPMALNWFEKALKLDPYHTKSLLQFYTYYNEVHRDASKATKYNNLILATDSLHPLGRFHKGAEIQEKAFLLKRGGPVFDSLMMLAIEEYTKALVRSPGYVQALYNRGYGFYALGMNQEAMQDFEQVLVSDKYHARSYFMMASIYEYQKDLENAKKYYEIALQLQPDFKEAEQAIAELK
jgi:tetratricopeptide (TPR) repeat protein